MWLQEAFLKAYGIDAPRRLEGPLIPPESANDPMWGAMADLRKAIHSFVAGRAPYTQGWMRSAIFLRVAAMKGGSEAFDSIHNAVWAYTSALIEGIGRLCDNPDLLKAVPDGKKFDVGIRIVAELRKAVEDQMRLLRDIGKAKIAYERDETMLALGRLMLKATHAMDADATGIGYRALCDAIGKFGPGCLPDTDWDAAVAVAHAVLEYEAHRCPETAFKRDDSASSSKCEAEEPCAVNAPLNANTQEVSNDSNC